ncbi:MAG TPA: hypothetical protein VJM08_12345 [Anaerolineales bacterium]|nr:hypothetical protein [Anaerolineales bacterium]
MIKKTFLTAMLVLMVLTTGAWQSNYAVRAASQHTGIAKTSVNASELAQVATFGKTSPANGATNVDPASITFSWQAYSPTPDSYSYCIKEGSPCVANDPHWTRTGLNRSVTLTNFAHGKTYYWQVRAIFCGNCVPKTFVYADNGTVWTFQTRVSQVTILGNAGVAGAVLSYTDGTPKTVTADSTGAYTIKVPFNWSGTITPSKAGYFFSPGSASFSNLTAPQVIQNFTARVAYSISGNVGVPGLTLSYVVDSTTHTLTADGSGNYSFLVPSGWNGTITPSHTCFTFSPPNRVYSNVTANQTAQNYTATFNSASGCADIDVLIAGSNKGNYAVPDGKSVRDGYPGVDSGPVKIVSVNNVDILSALRVIWREPGPRFSYSEMMGLPKEQLSTEYWFPWYNNLDKTSMEQGFRIANVDTTPHIIRVFVGNTQLGSDINLAGGAGTRVVYDVNNGPIRIACMDCSNPDDKIIAALRVIWNERGFRSSYSEMMGLPKEQLSSEYWFPWYNNAVPASMDQGFRIANVDLASGNTVEVRVGNTLLETITLAAGGSTRVGYNIDNGPLRIVCTTCSNTGNDKIIAALRVIWREPGFRSSYSEMMGLPKEQLSSEYWFPWYNNASPTTIVDQGFRIANVDTVAGNTVEVRVGGTLLQTISLPAGGSTRVGYNVDNGPIQILCTSCTNTGNDKIIVALRVIWREPGYRSSYSEMMGLPAQALSTEYWFPWYNNAFPNSMDQGFRIAVP